MKSKGGKKTTAKLSHGSHERKRDLETPAAENHSSELDDTDDDLPEEHIKNLEEALKGADRGEPVTLNEFRKMAKKWGKDTQKPESPKDQK